MDPFPCCLTHDDGPCPQYETGHDRPCVGPGAPDTCQPVTPVSLTAITQPAQEDQP